MERYTVLTLDGKMETINAKDIHEAELKVSKKYDVGILEAWKEVDNDNRGTKESHGKV